MTDSELTIWEHLDSVIRVLTSKEMGVWLYRRDKKILETELEKIKTEIDALYEVYEPYFKERLVIKSDVIQILDKHIKENKQ